MPDKMAFGAKQHLRLILNGKSADREDVRNSVEAVRQMGHKISVRVTYEAGDVRRLAGEALRDHEGKPIDTVVAGGGDGTLQEVLDGVMQNLGEDETPPFSFAVLPLGTANDFANQIGLDPADIHSCLRFAALADPKPTDIGNVNGSVFLNMATGGFGTEVTAQTDPQLKRVLGGAAYLFTGLNRFSELSACEGRIEADDFSWEGSFLAIAVGNGQQAGGGIRLCPHAKLDDGFLDLTIVPFPKSGTVFDLLAVLLESGVEETHTRFIQRRVRDLKIKTEKNFQFNLDGEPKNGQDWQIGIRQHRIRMRR
ncbi:lipid kinase YegS [Rhodobacterales bacterium]|nr:lipid kinase YegS [Rhodobacterales bacterium]